MTITIPTTNQTYTTPIVGSSEKELEDCLNWLVRQIQSLHPDIFKALLLKGQMTLAAGLMNLAESESELWNKCLNDHRKAIAETIGLEIEEEEEEEEDEIDAVLGFTEVLRAKLQDAGYAKSVTILEETFEDYLSAFAEEGDGEEDTEAPSPDPAEVDCTNQN